MENPSGSSANDLVFPNECSNAQMTPQEKLLEYSLFELTEGGGQATLTPTTADFGSVPVNLTSAGQTFTFTNTSTFQTTVSLLNATGDFAASGCSGVIAGGGSCNITVTFKPTALGARTGTLSVGSGSQTLTATLTGTGIPDLSISPTNLTFGSLDVGVSQTQSVTVTNPNSVGITMPAFTATGDYAVSTNCPATVPANSTCLINVSFKPTTYGTRTGTAGPADASNPAYGQMSVSLTGNGTDFSFALAPTSGQVIAGYSISTTGTVSPLGGFGNNVTVTCSTTAPGSTCAVANTNFLPSSATSTAITISTTSPYTVVGYGGLGGGGLLLLLTAGSGSLLWVRRRNTAVLLRSGAVLLLLLGAGFAFTGCSGKQPAQNANPTGPGNYTYTVTATDGTLSHSATYSLNVTAK